jgi:hypothetical protein
MMIRDGVLQGFRQCPWSLTRNWFRIRTMPHSLFVV